MKVQEYDRVASSLLAEAHAIETAKRPAYTIGDADVLANFKRVAERTGATPGLVLSVYMLKHIDAVVSALSRPDLPQAESVESRFADAINYLKLGYALLSEGTARVPVPAAPDAAAAPVAASPQADGHAEGRDWPDGGAGPDPHGPVSWTLPAGQYVIVSCVYGVGGKGRCSEQAIEVR